MHFLRTLIMLSLLALCACSAPKGRIIYRLTLENGALAREDVVLTPKRTYRDGKGFGWYATAPLTAVGGAISSEAPFYFAQQLPEGNYRVTVRLGATDGTSNTTIKAENRRLMIYDVSTEIGEQRELSFLVHIRTPRINDEQRVQLNAHEQSYLSWDNKLTLEFGGERPCVAALQIEPVTEVPVVYLCGNSTLVDQHREPYAGWGQFLPLFFKNVVVANHAESEATLRSFIDQQRLAKIGTTIKAGDYLFIQFGGNDQLDPYSSYQDQLATYIHFAREHEAIPVLLTPPNQHSFDGDGRMLNALGDFPKAMLELADRDSVALIDLHTMTSSLYEDFGPVEAQKLFVYYPANTFDDQPQELADHTHFSTFGAHELAKCVVRGLRQTDLPLKNHLLNNQDFNPASPDDYDNWKWPVSPLDEREEFEERR